MLPVCRHPLVEMVEVHSNESPTPRDPGRRWRTVFCRKCNVLRRGYLYTSGRFQLDDIRTVKDGFAPQILNKAAIRRLARRAQDLAVDLTKVHIDLDPQQNKAFAACLSLLQSLTYEEPINDE